MINGTNKKFKVWLPLLLSISMILGMMLGYRMKGSMPGKSFFSTDSPYPLQEVYDLVKNKYVDEVEMAKITDTAITAMLAHLDPHSVLIPAEELDAVNEDISGNFFGIGVEFDVLDDTIHVLNVMPDGPSAKAGIITGDKFIKVNDSVIAGTKIEEKKIKKLLRGKMGTQVLVEILRGAEKKQITITRGIIPVTSIDAAYMMDTATGYIRISKFTQVTYREFMEQLEKLKQKGLQKLVLDLRGNGGGILDQATEIADEFLDGDKLITYTQGNHFPKKEYRCKRPGLFESGRLVVLADEGSASASEILMGALQDWNRATIIGRRSFGKGLVQEQYELSNGSALRLTIARYYTPVGRSIQRPYSKGEKEYYDEINRRWHDGEVSNADSVKNDTTQAFKTPSGKTVYGGGGISPDIFIPADTTGLLSASMIKMYYKSTLSRYAYYYYMANKNSLANYKTPADFSANFSLNATEWNLFNDIARKDSINLTQLSAREKEQLSQRIRSSVARQVWRSQGYYQSINLIDDMIKKAREVLDR
ncbi:MAG: hypothetical protein RL172_957 [Bacteroidota bacterium]